MGGTKIYKEVLSKRMMDSIIKQIFDGKVNDSSHVEFVKYGKGIFANKYIVECKKQKDKWAIKTSAEFANFFVRKCLEKASGEIDMKGAIIATFKVADEAGFPIERVKQFMGIKQALVNTSVPVNKVLELMDKYPKAFFALSFTAGDCILKIKAKAPKSAKASSKGNKRPNADFCSLKTSDKKIVDDLLFGVGDFSEVSINHTLMIDQIILPKGETDSVRIRELAKKKGILKREVLVGEKKTVSEKPFLV